MSKLEHAALAYAEKGWPVHPLRPGTKTPATRHGFKDATCDSNQIRRWWRRQPDYNVGISVGAARLVVVDFDALQMAGELTQRGYLVPRTLSATTPRPGAHYWYRLEGRELRPSTGKLPGVPFPTPGVDLKAGDSYIVAPPSIYHGDDYHGKYEWLPFATEPADAPDWLREPERPTIRPAPPSTFSDKYMLAALQGEADKVRYSTPGTRNHLLNQAAYAVGQLVPHGLDWTTALAELLDAALATGLPEREARNTIKSGFGAGYDNPRGHL